MKHHLSCKIGELQDSLTESSIILKAMTNLVSCYNIKRKKIKIKFNENESTLTQKPDLLIFKFFITF